MGVFFCHRKKEPYRLFFLFPEGNGDGEIFVVGVAGRGTPTTQIPTIDSS